MNRITDTIFNSLPGSGNWSSAVLFQVLENEGIEVEDLSYTKRFTYTDELDFYVVFHLSSDKEKITIVELAAKTDQDGEGWSTWSKENEMERLKLQKAWMKARHISEVSQGEKRITCCFTPQDGASTISLMKV